MNPIQIFEKFEETGEQNELTTQNQAGANQGELEENDYILTSPIMHPRHSTTSNVSSGFFAHA
jgi:hypothetical protein